MKRIISKYGDKTLVNIPGTETWISNHFYENGVLDPEKKLPRHKFSVHILIEECHSVILDKKYRIWEIDGTRCVVFEDGVKYTMEEMEHLSGKSEYIIEKTHKAKKAFSGVVIQ